MDPKGSLICLCSVEFLGNAIRVGGYLDEDIYSSDEKIRLQMLERGRLSDNAADVVGRWVEFTTSCVDVFFPDLGSTLTKAFYAKYWGDEFIPECGHHIATAADACMPRVAVNRDILIFLLYCSAVATIIGAFDDIVMRADAENRQFRDHCDTYRRIWLHTAALLQLQVGRITEYSAVEQAFLQKELAKTSKNVCDIWRTAVEAAVEELSCELRTTAS